MILCLQATVLIMRNMLYFVKMHLGLVFVPVLQTLEEYACLLQY
jgi:hypothetical protein